jgi:Na+/H+ antiporter NhaD/arsenite permease-like protein
MIVGTMSGISYGQFARALLVPAAVSLVMVAALLQWMFRADLDGPPLAEAVHKLQRPPLDRKLLAKSLSVTGLAVAGFLVGFPLSWTALFAGALLMAIAGRVPRHALQRVDWPLLVFFAGLFVVVAGVGHAGVAERMYQGIAPLLGTGAVRQSIVFSLFTAVGSQIVSNVPFVILAGHWIPRMADPHLLWLATACAATLAGNLTLVGSVANLIVVEMAGGRISIGFWRFLRYGAVVTIATLAASLAILLAERAAGLV